jgi:PelA/Pel-15E family pectate lyase
MSNRIKADCLKTMKRLIHVFFLALVTLGDFAIAELPSDRLLKKPDDWFLQEEGREALKNILSWQTKHGDWPKNKDTSLQPFSGDSKKHAGTFDNGATSGELRVLAKACRVTGNDVYKRAFLAGFDHILEAQYPNGGWPQYFPLSEKYHRHITFNDGTMIRLLEFLRDSIKGGDFVLLDEARREAAARAIDRGVNCIVKCQVVVEGKLTVWCAQHDVKTLKPVMARSYELPSLSGAESAGILKFLMTIKDPSPEVIQAVESGIKWFETSKIEGYRYERSKTEPALTQDTSASPLWARFYEIETNRPMFCDRDGIVKYDIEEVGSERRDGYTWYGSWGSSLLATHKKWPYRQ